jgi:DNA-directed RNA polymerase beta' subunit
MTDIKEIDQLYFGILSHEEIVRQSVAEITKNKLTAQKSDANLCGTVYDPRMGPMESNQVCVTCGMKTKDCPGHFGHLTLNVKVVHPLYYRSLLQFMKCVCFRCSRLLVNKDHVTLWGLDRYQGEQRFALLTEKLSKIRFCTHCQINQPRYSVLMAESSFFITYKNATSGVQKVRISTDHIYANISKIPDEDIELMGFDPSFMRPVNLILTALPILAPRSRPFIVSDSISDDDLTLNYCEIIKVNNMLEKNDLSELKRQRAIDTLLFRIRSLFDNSSGKAKHTNARPFKGYKERLSGKDGLIRNNLMGKRVNCSARTVIGPDPLLKLNEIAVPEEICDTVPYAENVNRHNIRELQQLVWDGKVNMIDQKRKDGERRVHVRFALRNDNAQIRQKQCTIMIGDVVHRHHRTGDIVLFNRQPTLHKGSMLAKRIIRRPYKTIRMNLATTSTFNADFDGDEMNLFFPQSETARAELLLLASTEHNMIGAQSSNSTIVIVQDALLGSFLMTSNNDPIERDVFYQLTMRCDFSHEWMDRKLETIRQTYAKHSAKHTAKPLPLYCGKTLFSLLLPEDLNYTSKNKAMADEPILRIERGVVYEGAVNKANLKGGHSSLICVLHKYYSNQVAMQFVNDVQFLANEYMLYYGFSIGIGDCVMTRDAGNIDSIVAKCLLEAHEYSTTIKNERVREAKINLCLSKARDIGMRISKESLSKDNNFVKTVTAGSKGDYFNIAQVMGLLGQQNISGHRIEPQLNQGRRTLPHYPLHGSTEEYQSRGFIQNSFLKGLTPQEFWFHAMSGREGITDTAMKTAQSGYTMRRMVKLAEDVKVEYDGTVRNAMGSIIQFEYGGDSLCGTKTTLKNGEPVFCDVRHIADRLNTRVENRE